MYKQRKFSLFFLLLFFLSYTSPAETASIGHLYIDNEINNNFFALVKVSYKKNEDFKLRLGKASDYQRLGVAVPKYLDKLVLRPYENSANVFSIQAEGNLGNSEIQDIVLRLEADGGVFLKRFNIQGFYRKIHREGTLLIGSLPSNTQEEQRTVNAIRPFVKDRNNNLIIPPQKPGRAIQVAEKTEQKTSGAPSQERERAAPKTVKKAMTKQETRAQKAVTTFPQPEMVFIKGGCFQMGDMQKEGFLNESPVHEVCVDDFYMGKYEVSQKEWQAVMGKNPSKQKGDNLPVDSVSWRDTQNYLNKLNRLATANYRLPTEAEWEYACREKGKGLRFCNGENVASSKNMNFDGRKAYKKEYSQTGTYLGKTLPVNSLKPNKLGIYHMSGNVAEWVFDRYGADEYKKLNDLGKVGNPQGPPNGRRRVLKGGSWYMSAKGIRASQRQALYQDDKNSQTGFRLVLSKPQNP